MCVGGGGGEGAWVALLGMQDMPLGMALGCCSTCHAMPWGQEGGGGHAFQTCMGARGGMSSLLKAISINTDIQ